MPINVPLQEPVSPFLPLILLLLPGPCQPPGHDLQLCLECSPGTGESSLTTPPLQPAPSPYPVFYLLHSSAAAAKSLQSCLTLRPHRWQPTRLLRPWDFPGKSTGVDVVWDPPRCVWARESTAPAQGNQSLSRELRASALCPGLEARFPARPHAPPPSPFPCSLPLLHVHALSP